MDLQWFLASRSNPPKDEDWTAGRYHESQNAVYLTLNLIIVDESHTAIAHKFRARTSAVQGLVIVKQLPSRSRLWQSAGACAQATHRNCKRQINVYMVARLTHRGAPSWQQQRKINLGNCYSRCRTCAEITQNMVRRFRSGKKNER